MASAYHRFGELVNKKVSFWNKDENPLGKNMNSRLLFILKSISFPG